MELRDMLGHTASYLSPRNLAVASTLMLSLGAVDANAQQPQWDNVNSPNGVPDDVDKTNVTTQQATFYDRASRDYRPVNQDGNILIDNGTSSYKMRQRETTGDGPEIGAYESTGAALPVELGRFTARRTERNNEPAIRFKWTTLSETNTAAFEVERETPSGWDVVGRRDAAGNTTDRKEYRVTDDDLGRQDTLDYRLTETTTQGDQNTIAEETIVRRLQDADFTIAPNPVDDRATSLYTVPEQASKSDVSIQIYDTLGRRVADIDQDDVGSGQHQRRLSPYIDDLSSGVYIARFRIDGDDGYQHIDSEKFTVVR